jgi:hypothetical protein
MKNGVGSVVGSGSISQRYGSGDPDPHQNVMDPQHWCCGSANISLPLTKPEMPPPLQN